MVTIVGIRFKKTGKIYYFAPGNLDIKKGDKVIVETSRGVEMGDVVIGMKELDDNQIVHPLKMLIRIATLQDIKQAGENIQKEKDAYITCTQKIKEHKLSMKLIDVEYTFDRNKILFYFTADGRIDFRELVKDLAGIFRTRIELRQIGVRDEAKMIGGLGICGKKLCCSSFLGEFEPVSIKMAKEQNLSLNPSKISGTCGRLMCCLRYEQNAYEELIKRMPKVNAIVSTPQGKGVVVDVSLIKEMVKVKLDKGDEKDLQEFKASEIKVIKDGEKNNNNDEDLED
jgi:cell fate regulator YaaT (PSP1 superfamily)